jgi:CelD/BcsL family acetyltransferase involved in cellulose biosynthesis
MNDCRVRRWTADEFLANRAAWQQLLGRSDADALFMSWDWVSTWWRHRVDTSAAQLYVLGVYADSGELCGIAPLYTHQARHRGVFRARRFELLGNTWRDPAAVFSEYLDIIAAREARAAVAAAVAGWLRANPDWDELLLCNLRTGSVAEQLAGSLSDTAYLRTVESMTGWSITLPASFETFVTRLSSNTRRKAVNQRGKVADVSFVSTPASQRRAALERLDTFVARRWDTRSQGISPNSRGRFHAELIEQLASDDAVRLTELVSGAHCVSVMLNLRMGGTEYYLQSGFDAAFARGLSPGYLHLGYAIEAACRDGLRSFDFLAGRGLHRDYKQDFAASSAPLQTLHLVRKPVLRLLFQVFDGLRGRDLSHKSVLRQP